MDDTETDMDQGLKGLADLQTIQEGHDQDQGVTEGASETPGWK